MLKNVMVGARAPTEDNTDDELITISRKEYARIMREREEYRAICLDFASEIPKFHRIADNIETILSGGASE